MAKGDRPGTSGLDLIAEAWKEFQRLSHTNPLDLPVAERAALKDQQHAARDKLDILLGTDTRPVKHR